MRPVVRPSPEAGGHGGRSDGAPQRGEGHCDLRPIQGSKKKGPDMEKKNLRRVSLFRPLNLISAALAIVSLACAVGGTSATAAPVAAGKTSAPAVIPTPTAPAP